MPADRTPIEHDDRGAPETSGATGTIPLPPDAADHPDGPDDTEYGSAADGLSADTEDPFPNDDAVDIEEADDAEADDIEEPAATTAGPDVLEASTPADDDPGRDPLVTDPLPYQSRWDDIQAGFVDEPRHSVADADALVAEVIDEITAGFASTRAELEEQWSRGDVASTEDLRLAFRRYRSFFQRLVSA